MNCFKMLASAKIQVDLDQENDKKVFEFEGSVAELQAAITMLIVEIAKKYSRNPQDIAENIMLGTKAAVALEDGANPVDVIVDAMSDFLIKGTVKFFESEPQSAACHIEKRGRTKATLTPESMEELKRIMEGEDGTV